MHSSIGQEHPSGPSDIIFKAKHRLKLLQQVKADVSEKGPGSY